jgi:hypothetical protein
MSNFNYNLKIIDMPSEGSPGSRLNFKVIIDDATKPVGRVYLSVSMYGVFEVLKKESDNVFSFNYYIPYDAPRVSYDVSLWAVSESGERGPATNVTFRVI